MQSSSKVLFMICVIIDSGLNKKYTSNKRIIGTKCFYLEEDEVKESNEIIDEDGHGSACFHILDKYTTNCYFFIIKILKNGKADLRLLYAALNYCLKIDCDIINISLATNCENSNLYELENIIRSISNKDIITVASYPNNGSDGYPANSSEVIGVKGVLSDDCNYCDVTRLNTGKIILTLNLLPEVTARENGKYYLFGGNSKATALATAKIIDILNNFKESSIDTVFDVLKQNVIKNGNVDRSFDQFEKFLDDNITISKLHIRVTTILFELSNHNVDFYDNLVKLNIISPLNALNLVKKLEHEFGIKIDDDKIKFSDFASVDNIVKLVNSNDKFEIY